MGVNAGGYNLLFAVFIHFEKHQICFFFVSKMNQCMFRFIRVFPQHADRRAFNQQIDKKVTGITYLKK